MKLLSCFTACLLTVGTVLPAAAQIGAAGGEWRTYGGDLGNTRYSPLDQINAGNFNKLEIAWRFKTDGFIAKFVERAERRWIRLTECDVTRRCRITQR